MGIRSALVVIAFGVATTPGTPAAVAVSPTVRTGSIRGIVYDSLVAMAPLPGAEVTVEGTSLAVLTDRDGRFRIDSVPAGKVALRFYHARLDSLGFGSAPVVVDVPLTGATVVKLATPSPATFYARLCGSKPAPSTGALLGVVRDVDDRKPLPNANVEIAWIEWTFRSGMVRTERRDSTVTNANGAFALCGVPADVPIAARAKASDHVTGIVEVDFSTKLFAVQDFGVSVADSATSAAAMARLDSAAARGDSLRPAGSALVRGTVRDGAGTAIDGAQIAMSGFAATAVTASTGAFSVAAVPAGTQSFEVRAIGYVPQRLTLDLRSGDQRDVEVVLARGNAQSLAAVNIVGRGASFDRTGFSARLKAGVGQFITQEQIERRRVSATTQLLWFSRGVHLVPGGATSAVRFPRPPGHGITQTGGSLSERGIPIYCTPAFWVDGFYIGGTPDEVNSVVRPTEIRGIELYLDPATAPTIYQRSDVACGLVLIWTKPPEPKLAR